MGGDVILHTVQDRRSCFNHLLSTSFAKAFAKTPAPPKKGNKDIYIYIPLNPLKMTVGCHCAGERVLSLSGVGRPGTLKRGGGLIKVAEGAASVLPSVSAPDFQFSAAQRSDGARYVHIVAAPVISEGLYLLFIISPTESE